MEDKLFPLKKSSFWRGRMTDTEISEVGMRRAHNAIATGIPALSGPRLSVYCSYCIKINQPPCGSLFFWVLQSVLILFLKCFNFHNDHIIFRREWMGQGIRE